MSPLYIVLKRAGVDTALVYTCENGSIWTTDNYRAAERLRDEIGADWEVRALDAKA